LGRSFFRSD